MRIYLTKYENTLYNQLFLYALLIISFTSPNPWSSIPILNTQIERIIQFFILFLSIKIISNKNICFYKTYRIVFLYLVWAAIGIIRGILIADCYWEYNQLTIGIMSLSLPLIVYIFDNPKLLLRFNRLWIKWCIPLFFIFYYWTVGAIQFYLSPIFLFSCFIPILNNKWKIIISILLIMMLFNITNRSQVMKVIICFFFSSIYYYRNIIPITFYKLFNATCYILPLILLYLGISGQFNIFADGIASSDKQINVQNSTGKIENLNIDTRTFLYKEVIESAVKHKYILVGRTPALGNDSDYFGDSYNIKYSKGTRYMNELCHLNILTWLGLIGVILNSLIYLRASFLAIYQSNSFALKLLGCYIAFNWLFGWIENMNRFDIFNISLWAIIAMGFSRKFRSYTDHEFETWFKHIFRFK